MCFEPKVLFILAVFGLAFALVLTGCDGSGSPASDNNQPGTFTVTFTSASRTVVPPQTVTEGALATKPTPTRMSAAAAVAQVNANPGRFTLVIDDDISTPEVTLTAAGAHLTIIGLGEVREISTSGVKAFIVGPAAVQGSDTSLTLGENITLVGRSVYHERRDNNRKLGYLVTGKHPSLSGGRCCHNFRRWRRFCPGRRDSSEITLLRCQGEEPTLMRPPILLSLAVMAPPGIVLMPGMMMP